MCWYGKRDKNRIQQVEGPTVCTFDFSVGTSGLGDRVAVGENEKKNEKL
jgi:hypothetical protein